MNSDLRVGGGASAHIYRHAVTSCISSILCCLEPLRDPVAKRRVGWTPHAAGVAAVLMALDSGSTLQCRFKHARSCMKADYRGRRRPGATYNGLLKALERQHDTVMPIVKSALREHVRQRCKRIDGCGNWSLMAVDGSKEGLPRTRDHEDVFGIADNGIYPQAFITAIVEVHTGLLWDWRIGGARASEKHHFEDMIPDLPDDALLLADAGFVGHPIWSKLCTQGTAFLIRVGSNVRLLKDLWPDARTRQERDVVYAWPKTVRRTTPPLKLRLIRVGSGKRAVYLLTNVLASSKLSRRTAGAIYRKRWGVELFYRTFKRTLGYAKLRSKAARRATIEFEWTLVAISVATLLGIDALIRRRQNPKRLSPAQVLQVLRDGMRDRRLPRPRDHRLLHHGLGQCMTDDYKRTKPKQSRHRIKTTNTPNTRLRPPAVRTATREEQRDAMKYAKQQAA